ncbi:hypothetical protein EON81_27555, partial [bacterium]
MGRPRQAKVDAIKFRAWRDSESKEFDSRREATLFASGARRTSRVDPIYFKCRYWVLEIERVPLPGEELWNEEDMSGHRLTEREAVIKGNDDVALRTKAEGLRRASFARDWQVVNLAQNLLTFKSDPGTINQSYSHNVLLQRGRLTEPGGTLRTYTYDVAGQTTAYQD